MRFDLQEDAMSKTKTTNFSRKKGEVRGSDANISRRECAIFKFYY